MTQRSKPSWNSSTSIHSKRVVKETKPPQYNHRPRDPYLPTPSLSNMKRSLSVSSSICSLEQEEFQLSAMTPEEKIQGFEQLLTSKNHSDRELRESLRVLRRMIMVYGLPESKTNSDTKIATLRGKIWKVLLGVYKVSALEYIKIVEKGPCEVMDKIKNDTFRTCATDKQFVDRVSHDMLSRVLNAFVWKAKEQPPSRLINLSFSYVQGMNVMAAPFLYVLPELDAFFTFSAFVQNACPLYVQPALEGAHCGVKLLDMCMKVVDKELYRYLKSKDLNATLYAFPSVMTFSACTPPLSEALKLWDFLLAYGIHLNILCIISQIILIRSSLFISDSPMKLLRTLPDLQAKKIIQITLSLIPQLPEDLYDMLVRHPFDPFVHDILLPENVSSSEEE